MLCFEYKVVDIKYFMDELQAYEVNDIIECLPYTERNEWERCRYSIYSNLQMNCKKKINPTDIMQFEWDKKETTTSISNEDIQRLKQKSKQIYGK